MILGVVDSSLEIIDLSGLVVVLRGVDLRRLSPGNCRFSYDGFTKFRPASAGFRMVESLGFLLYRIDLYGGFATIVVQHSLGFLGVDFLYELNKICDYIK